MSWLGQRPRKSKIEDKKLQAHTKQQQQQQLKSKRNPSVEKGGSAKPICEQIGSVNERDLYMAPGQQGQEVYIDPFAPL